LKKGDCPAPPLLAAPKGDAPNGDAPEDAEFCLLL